MRRLIFIQIIGFILLLGFASACSNDNVEDLNKLNKAFEACQTENNVLKDSILRYTEPLPKKIELDTLMDNMIDELLENNSNLNYNEFFELAKLKYSNEGIDLDVTSRTRYCDAYCSKHGNIAFGMSTTAAWHKVHSHVANVPYTLHMNYITVFCDTP